MWHEARKQERKIRGMLVDYRRRAERRQDFYEKIKADPTQFMQIHGRKCKIHLDPAIAAAGESPAVMMPWQGQNDNMIDRFDGRAYLDIDRIPIVSKVKELEEISADERHCNYERYRILAQNDFLGISEDKYLHQLYLEEQFGINAQFEMEKPKKKTGTGAAIPFTYEDSNDINVPFTQTIAHVMTAPSSSTGGDDESDSDLDVDVAIDVSKIDAMQGHELNTCGRHYGMKSNDFYSFLTKDSDEADALKLAREEEQEKIMLSGRKSRRERRAQRERRFAGRPISPPSYAAKEEPPFKDDEKNESAESRSSTPENSGKITYITSFGGEDELQPHSKISINFKNQKSQASGSLGELSTQAPSYADKVKQNLEKLKQLNSVRARSSESPKKPLAYQRRDGSYSRSHSRSRTRRSRSSYRKRSGRRNSYSRSRSRSTRNRRRSVSRRRNSRSKYRRSRSRSNYRNHRRSYSSRSTPQLRHRKSTSSSTSTTSSSSSKSITSDVSKSRSRSSLARSKSKSLPIKEDPTITAPILVQPTFHSIPVAKEETTQIEPQAPIKKYYGRRREDLSSDEMNADEEEEASMSTSQQSSNLGGTTNSSSSTKLGKQLTTNDNKTTSSSKSFNPRDRLKRKMQILLNKQYKADKLAEIEKTERQIQQQQEREDEMRELALRLRRRQRELRHRYGTPTTSHSETSDGNTDDEHTIKSKESPRNGGGVTLKKSPVLLRSRSRSRGHSSNRRLSRERKRSNSDSRRRSYSRRRYRSRSRERSYRDSYSGRQRSRDRDYRSRSRDSRRRTDRERVNRNERAEREKSRTSRKLVDY